MSRHEKDLEDMHDLLQQMKDMHGEYHVPDHTEGFLNNVWQAGNKMAGSITDQDIIDYFFKHFEKNGSQTDRPAIGDFKMNQDISNTDIDMKDNSQKGLLLKYCSITKQNKLLDILKSKHPGEHNITAEHKHTNDKDKMIHNLKSVQDPATITSIFDALVTISACRNEMMKNWSINPESIKSIIQGIRKAENDAKKEANKGKSWLSRIRGT